MCFGEWHMVMNGKQYRVIRSHLFLVCVGVGTGKRGTVEWHIKLFATHSLQHCSSPNSNTTNARSYIQEPCSGGLPSRSCDYVYHIPKNARGESSASSSVFDSRVKSWSKGNRNWVRKLKTGIRVESINRRRCCELRNPLTSPTLRRAPAR